MSNAYRSTLGSNTYAATEFITSGDVDLRISALAGATWFGAAIAHPQLTVVNVFSDVVGTNWAQAYSLVSGVNSVESRAWTNNADNVIKKGSYSHHVNIYWQPTTATATYRSDLVIFTASNNTCVATNVIDTGLEATLTANITNEYDSTAYVLSNITLVSTATTTQWLGVVRYATRSVGGTGDLTIYGGASYPTRLELPAQDVTVAGVITLTNDASANAGVIIGSSPGTVFGIGTAGGSGLTNVDVSGAPGLGSYVSGSTAVITGIPAMVWTDDTRSYTNSVAYLFGYTNATVGRVVNSNSTTYIYIPTNNPAITSSGGGSVAVLSNGTVKVSGITNLNFIGLSGISISVTQSGSQADISITNSAAAGSGMTAITPTATNLDLSYVNGTTFQLGTNIPPYLLKTTNDFATAATVTIGSGGFVENASVGSVSIFTNAASSATFTPAIATVGLTTWVTNIAARATLFLPYTLQGSNILMGFVISNSTMVATNVVFSKDTNYVVGVMQILADPSEVTLVSNVSAAATWSNPKGKVR
jgi:hypothetical protein